MAKDDIKDILVDQYNASLKWMSDNFYPEFQEIYRTIRAKVVPLTDKKGNVIKNRTNICLPDHAVMRRKKVARLTAAPPNLRVRGGTSQEQRDKIAALNYRQWDLSGEQLVFEQVVDSAVSFGWGVAKDYWNKVTVVKQLRRAVAELSRTQYMLAKGAPAEEIQAAVDELGPDLSEEERIQALSELGSDVTLPFPTTKYEGPQGERIFIGDIFPEPGFTSLNKSAFVIEHTEWDERRLKWLTQQTTTDPEGNVVPVFDERAVQELLDMKGAGRDNRKPRELRQQLWEADKKANPQDSMDERLRGPRFAILERHTIDNETGRIVIDWVGAEKVTLGRKWYEWDLGGKYLYTELVLQPDLMGGIGDSNIRLSRFLMQMRNARMNQIQDFVNNKLRPLFKRTENADIPDEAFERSGWREVVVKHPDDLSLLLDPQFPAEAFTDTAQLVREMQQVEPLANDFQPGTETVPQAGRLATTAVFQQRAADSVTAAEMKRLDLYLYERLNKRMAMTQQAMTEAQEVETGVSERVDALKLVADGEARAIKIDPMEIQEDLEIIPETGSTLAADDEFKKQSIMNGYAIAKSDPENFNTRAFAQKLIETMPGMKVEEALMPLQTEPPPPETKVSVSINYKDLAPDAKVAFLQKYGLPVEGTQAGGALELPLKVAEAANAAADLEEEYNPEVGPSGRVSVKKGKPKNAPNN